MFESALVFITAGCEKKIEVWRKEYNSFMPHSSLGNLTPNEYLIQYSIPADSLLLTGPVFGVVDKFVLFLFIYLLN